MAKKRKKASLAKRRSTRKAYQKAAKKYRPGEGGRFKALTEAVKAGGAKVPEAVAAAIGRKKYGKKKFQRMAAKGRRRKR